MHPALLAADMSEKLVTIHPFIDGNKRTGYVVMETFLVINGYQLTATPQDKYITFLNLAEGTFTEDDLAEWLRDRLAAG